MIMKICFYEQSKDDRSGVLFYVYIFFLFWRDFKAKKKVHSGVNVNF